MSTENEQLEDLLDEDTTKDKFLTFLIDNEEFGVEIANIKEIISITPITRVPGTPGYVKGIVNLRGDIIPVIDVRGRFSKPGREYDDLTCIVVIEKDALSIGLIVDNVREVMFINEENILPPPSARLNFHNQFIKSIGQVGPRIVLLMDLDKFLLDE